MKQIQSGGYQPSHKASARQAPQSRSVKVSQGQSMSVKVSQGQSRSVKVSQGQSRFLVRLDLLTDLELDRVGRAISEAVWPYLSMALSARSQDWFWRRTSAYFGEARVGFPVGKICLFQNAVGLWMSLLSDRSYECLKLVCLDPLAAFVDVGSEQMHVSIAGGSPEVFGGNHGLHRFA